MSPSDKPEDIRPRAMRQALPVTPPLWRLVRAIAHKELLQILRDRLTLALLLGVPLAQILLFGFAIELAPRHWPTAWVTSAPGDALAELAQLRLDQQGWLRVERRSRSLDEALGWMQRGDVRFIVVWPAGGPKAAPVRLLADLSDPFAGAALAGLLQDLAGPAATDAKFNLALEVRHAARKTAGEYLVPALAGVILTLTLTLLAALAIVREVERGTWHGLLTSPAGALAIVLGKLLCYLGLGTLLYVALSVLASALFDSPAAGAALASVALLFMLANLGLGLCLSLLARTQMQAMQLGVFFYLPSILLSGFMFPFHAMPAWARGIGEVLPLTHFLRCLRASLIRSADAATIASLAWPIAVFALLALGLAWAGAYRRIERAGA